MGKSDDITMYDMDDQNNMSMDKIDRKSIIFFQLIHLQRLSVIDPDEKGKFHTIIVGGGNNPIIEKKYLDHPHHSFFEGVMFLYDLLTPEREDDKTFKDKYEEVVQSFSTYPKYHVGRTHAIFRLLILLIEENYGADDKIIDSI